MMNLLSVARFYRNFAVVFATLSIIVLTPYYHGYARAEYVELPNWPSSGGDWNRCAINFDSKSNDSTYYIDISDLRWTNKISTSILKNGNLLRIPPGKDTSLLLDKPGTMRIQSCESDCSAGTRVHFDGVFKVDIPQRCQNKKKMQSKRGPGKTNEIVINYLPGDGTVWKCGSERNNRYHRERCESTYIDVWQEFADINRQELDNMLAIVILR